MTLVVPNLTLRSSSVQLGAAQHFAEGRYPIFEATPVTHDLYCWENAADEPQPPLSRSDLVLWHIAAVNQEALCPQLARADIMAERVDSGFAE